MKTKKQKFMVIRSAMNLIIDNTEDSDLKNNILDELKSLLPIHEITCPSCSMYDIDNVYGENYCVCVNCETSWQVDLKI